MPTPTTKKVRWGIMGTAEIARKNWKAIQLTGNSTVSAVASRDLGRAQRFISECQAEAPMEFVPQAFGNYGELIASKEVEAVYIPLPTGLRKRWVLRAAEAGKHVLCEKPCAESVSDFKEMSEACREHGVQFMDDVMFVHSRRFERLREILDEGKELGRLKRIESAFSFPGSADFFANNIRMQSQLESHGCLGDLGWYNIRLSLWVMKWQMPVEVCGRVLGEGRGAESKGTVPTEFSGELVFEGGISSGFFCSFEAGLQQWAMISGTRGYVEIGDFVLPFAGNRLGLEIRQSDYKIRGCDFRMETDERPVVIEEWSHGQASAQEVRCFGNFAQQVRSGQLNELWPEQALKTQTVMEACLESARHGGIRLEV